MDVTSLARSRFNDTMRRYDASPLDLLIKLTSIQMSAEDEVQEERKRISRARAEAKAQKAMDKMLKEGKYGNVKEEWALDPSKKEKIRQDLVGQLYRQELFKEEHDGMHRGGGADGGGGASSSSSKGRGGGGVGGEENQSGNTVADEASLFSSNSSKRQESAKRSQSAEGGRQVKEKATVVLGERSMTLEASVRNWKNNRRGADGVGQKWRNFPYGMTPTTMRNRITEPRRNVVLNRQLRDARALKLSEDDEAMAQLEEACEVAMERQVDGEKLRLGRIATPEQRDYSGELRRRGNVATWQWTAGFYVVADGILYEFAGDTLASTIVGVWPILASTVRRGKASSQLYQHVFELHLNPRFVDDPILSTVEFATPTKESRQLWIDALDKASLKVSKSLRWKPEEVVAEQQRRQHAEKDWHARQRRIAASRSPKRQFLKRLFSFGVAGRTSAPRRGRGRGAARDVSRSPSHSPGGPRFRVRDASASPPPPASKNKKATRTPPPPHPSTQQKSRTGRRVTIRG